MPLSKILRISRWPSVGVPEGAAIVAPTARALTLYWSAVSLVGVMVEPDATVTEIPNTPAAAVPVASTVPLQLVVRYSLTVAPASAAEVTELRVRVHELQDKLRELMTGLGMGSA